MTGRNGAGRDRVVVQGGRGGESYLSGGRAGVRGAGAGGVAPNGSSSRRRGLPPGGGVPLAP